MTQTPDYRQTLDIPFARKVLDYARGEHKDFVFNMGSILEGSSCGTSACLAGTAVFLHPEVEVVRLGNNASDTEVLYQGKPPPAGLLDLATDLLGLHGAPTDGSDDLQLYFTMDVDQALSDFEAMIVEAEKVQYGG